LRACNFWEEIKKFASLNNSFNRTPAANIDREKPIILFEELD
jgi:hypothetical protein